MAVNSTRLALLEAILFTTDKPMATEQIQKIMKGRRDEIEKLITALREKYSKPESGISLTELGGYRLVVKQEFMAKVSDLTPHADLSRGLLRVLSIIAYHQPISQSNIVKVIGNRTYDYVKELEEKGLVRSEKKSRTKMLITTPHFEEYFGARIDDIKKIAQEEEEKKDE